MGEQTPLGRLGFRFLIFPTGRFAFFEFAQTVERLVELLLDSLEQ